MNKEFWETKYLNNEAKWHAGAITTPLKEYIDQLKDKSIRILVPGMGHGHELMYLYQQGFSNIVGLDFTDVAIRESYGGNEKFPFDKISLGDFFLHNGEYDLILEQTFFCSLPRAMRKNYVDKMYSLLADNGKIVGVLFDCEFEQETPPFGGSEKEYRNLFETKFDFSILEKAHNSIKPRAGRELFFITTKQHD